MPNGALQEMFKTLQILFINYIKFVPYILARPSAGLNVFEKCEIFSIAWSWLVLLGNLSNNDDDGSENVAIKNEFASFQTFSYLFSPLQFVKCRWFFLDLNC